MPLALLKSDASPIKKVGPTLLILIPALIWLGLIQARPKVIHPYCGANPASCSAAAVPEIDRPCVGLSSGDADRFSYVTQNLSGYLALGVPPLWSAGAAVLGRISPAVALMQAGTDLAIVLQTTVINGMLMEATRITVQRPRPYVYADAQRNGGDPSSYVSFYSGHTSFAAAVGMALLLILRSRGAPKLVLVLAALSGTTLTFLTGIFRVLAGRHFVTDVLTAMIAGALVAWAVASFHRRRKL